MKYPVFIEKDIDSDYGVIVPDVPGCFSAGSSIEEALGMVHEAIECHLEGLLMDNEPIPVVSDIEKHQKDKKYTDGIWALIEIDISKLSVKSKRVNVTIPERLLNTIDQYAKRHGETRSGLLAQAVTEYMSVHN